MPQPARPAGLTAGLRMAALVLTCAPAFGGVPALADPPPRRLVTPAPAPQSIVFTPAAGAFESALRRRLESEARRQKLGLDMPFIVAPGEDIEAPGPEHGRRVQRTILRALRGALDERLEGAARGSVTFAPLFRLIDGRDNGAPGWSAGPAPAPRGLGDFALRFRLDAHPRLQIGARLGAVNGRIELPLLERELRLSIDRPIGGHGGASLRGGRSADRGDWADLALHFRF